MGKGHKGKKSKKHLKLKLKLKVGKKIKFTQKAYASFGTIHKDATCQKSVTPKFNALLTHELKFNPTSFDFLNHMIMSMGTKKLMKAWSKFYISPMFKGGF